MLLVSEIFRNPDNRRKKLQKLSTTLFDGDLNRLQNVFFMSKFFDCIKFGLFENSCTSLNSYVVANQWGLIWTVVHFEGVSLISSLHLLIIGPTEARADLMARLRRQVGLRPEHYCCSHSLLHVHSSLLRFTSRAHSFDRTFMVCW